VRFKFILKPIIQYLLNRLSIIVLTLKSLRKSKQEIYLVVGDSHSCYISNTKLVRFAEGPFGFFSFWVGPRLMYSIAHKGFPVSRMEKSALKRMNFSAICFSFGEIDIRAHLAENPDFLHASTNWINLYIMKCIEFANDVCGKLAVIIIPPPPSDWAFDNISFPKRGDLQQRVSAHNTVRKLLLQSASDTRNITAIDLTNEFSDQQGELSRQFSDDGCHINFHGASMIHSAIKSKFSTYSQL